LLLEADSALGSGATGRNAGILSAGINMGLAELPLDGPDAAMWPETTGLLRSLAQHAREPGTVLAASLTAALSPDETRSATRTPEGEVRAGQAMHLHADLWTAEQVGERAGQCLNTATVVAALWLPDEGRIHPLTLLAHLAQQARAKGVMLAGAARVLDCVQEQHGSALGMRWSVTVEGGISIGARGLILALGPTVAPTARIYALAFHADLPDDFPL